MYNEALCHSHRSKFYRLHISSVPLLYEHFEFREQRWVAEVLINRQGNEA